MQYTASSFAQPIVEAFSFLLLPVNRQVRIDELFPGRTRFRSHVPDLFGERIYQPVAEVFRALIVRSRRLQPANVHFFAGYIIVTLVLLVLWNYFFGGSL